MRLLLGVVNNATTKPQVKQLSSFLSEDIHNGLDKEFIHREKNNTGLDKIGLRARGVMRAYIKFKLLGKRIRQRRLTTFFRQTVTHAIATSMLVQMVSVFIFREGVY